MYLYMFSLYNVDKTTKPIKRSYCARTELLIPDPSDWKMFHRRLSTSTTLTSHVILLAGPLAPPLQHVGDGRTHKNEYSELTVFFGDRRCSRFLCRSICPCLSFSRRNSHASSLLSPSWRPAISLKLSPIDAHHPLSSNYCPPRSTSKNGGSRSSSAAGRRPLLVGTCARERRGVP